MSTESLNNPSISTSKTTSHSKIEVVNKYHGHLIDPYRGNFYIGRGSPVGNPYTVEEYGRTDAIDQYKKWLKQKIHEQDSSVTDYLNTIYKAAVDKPNGVKLVCFCKPRPCHGDYIKQVIEEMIQKCEIVS